MRRLSFFFLALGIVLFVVLLREMGARVVLENIQMVGWIGIGSIVVLESLAHAANTGAWWFTFAENRHAVRLQHLFGIRLAGEAINYLTPAAMGGDFLKAVLLKKKMPMTTGLATLTIAKLSQAIALGIFIIGGFSIVSPLLSLSPLLKDGIMLLGIGGVLSLALFFFLQRLGLFAGLLGLLNRLQIRHRFLTQMEEPARMLDQNIARFYLGHGKRFWISVCWFFLGWAVGVLEIYLIMRFLHLPTTIFTALAVEVLSTLLNAILFFIPGNLGTQEGGKVLIFTLLGLDTAQGFSLGVVRRIRELTWVAIGLLILALYQRAHTPERNVSDGSLKSYSL